MQSMKCRPSCHSKTRALIDLWYQKCGNHIANSAVNWTTWSITDTKFSAPSHRGPKLPIYFPKHWGRSNVRLVKHVFTEPKLREWWIHIINPSKHEAITPKWLPQRQSKSKSTTYHCRFETKIKLFASRKWNSLVLLLKIAISGLKFRWNLSQSFQLTTSRHWFRDNGSKPYSWQAIIWTFVTDTYMCISLPWWFTGYHLRKAT